jgi:hypothetical protein
MRGIYLAKGLVEACALMVVGAAFELIVGAARGALGRLRPPVLADGWVPGRGLLAGVAGCRLAWWA